MNNGNIQQRYWSPDQTYAAGDVLITLLDEGWQVIGSAAVSRDGCARLHAFTLTKSDTAMTRSVPDCPSVGDILDMLSTPHSHAA